MPTATQLSAALVFLDEAHLSHALASAYRETVDPGSFRGDWGRSDTAQDRYDHLVREAKYAIQDGV